MLSLLEAVFGVLEILAGVLETIGHAFSVIDSSAHPTTLRRRWPAILLLWLLAGLLLAFGVYLIRSLGSSLLEGLIGWVLTLCSPLTVAALTRRWRQLAWPTPHR